MPRVGSLGSDSARGFGFGGTRGPSPPVNNVAPVVSGTAQAGQTITTTNGTWSNSPTSYTYQWYYAGSTPISGGTGTSVVVPDAAVGWYIWCVVTAINAGGSTSAQSQFFGPCVAGAPGAPIIGTATATGTTTATVTFSAPTSDGGATITQYQCYDYGNNLRGTLNQSTGGTFYLTGLSAGTSYQFKVRAVNSAGTGPFSVESNQITTQAAPATLYVDGVAFNSTGYLYYTGSARVLTVNIAKTIIVTMWGGAGGNGGYTPSSTNQSGGGGYTRGTVTLQPGQNYYLYVGGGGLGPSAVSYGSGGAGGWPNGGYGTMGDASGAGGGGMSMLSRATFSTGMTDAQILMIAGGGGGSTGYAGAAGAGGGGDGQTSSSNQSVGGTQTTGGRYNGAKLMGGNATGSQSSGSDDGGGGGGGYYGGGGGTSDAFPGSGGSGFINTTYVTSASTLTGNYKDSPNPNATLPSGYASGKMDTYSPQNGNPGIVYIQI